MNTPFPKPRAARQILTWLPATLILSWTASATEFFVGPGHYATIQEAVDAAADPANLDADNFVSIQWPLVSTVAAIVVGDDFNEDRRLVIRPDPAQPGLRRVTVAALHGFAPILLLTTAGSATVQDLDLIRHVTNFEDLVRLDRCTNVVIQRCRIGSDWSTAGLASAANLRIIQPKHNAIRNCLCFSAVAGHFERGISVEMASAMDRSVLLDNNVVADYDGDGIYLQADGDCYAVLRNNVMANRVTISPEPDAIHSLVTPLVIVDSSHNTAFATAAHVEEQDGALAIQGDDLLRFEPIRVGEAFHKFEWVTAPDWDPNLNFFRLMDGGLLRRDATDEGTRVAAGYPGERDEAVTDDWERDARPDNDDERTDRGADQIALLTAGDLRVILPGIPSFTGASRGDSGSDEFEIVAVGPQEDLPFNGEMAGGDYRISGQFASVVLAVAIHPDLPPATRFDGSPLALIEWPADARYDASIAMTVEAWVRREDGSRTEAILTHGPPNSFWFGFVGPLLRFARSGGMYADSAGTVITQRWTHVAAAYDGTRVAFFIDGQSAGVSSLGNAGAGHVAVLRLGGDGEGANFRGTLDEVRLWNVCRLEAEIRQAMHNPILPNPGLVGLFPSGGAWEAVAGLPGQPGTGVFPDAVGIVFPTLEVPRAWFPMTMDGEVHPWSEYLGAVQVPIRYDADDGVPDAWASLVYRNRTGDQNLYIGVTGLRDVPQGRDRSNSWVAVTFDADWSLDGTPQFGDFEVRGFLDGRQPELWFADGLGNWVNLGFQPGGNWDVVPSFPTEFGPADLEFRIAREWLTQPPEPADWNGTDGLMIGHYHVESDGDNYLNPAGARLNEPATWVPTTYVANTVRPVTVTMTGYVFDNNDAHPMANHPVELRDDATGETLMAANTSRHGYFSFNGVYVPPDRNLRLEVGTVANCMHLQTQVAETDLQPVEPRELSVQPQLVIFPPPTVDSNRYAVVTFTLRQPIGEMALASYDPIEGVPRLRLRDTPEKLIPSSLATIVKIYGTNIHQDIQVFLYSCLNLPPENLANAGGCVLNEDYFEARIVNRAADDSWVRVEVPHVPRRVLDNPWPGPWGWAVKDNWARPERGDEWRRLGGFVGTNFSLQLPPYPLVFGFEFDNHPFEPSHEDFDGVFGWNGWLCEIPLIQMEDCPCAFRNPYYESYFTSIYEPWLRASGGSCNGLSATSLLFYWLVLDAEDNALLFGDEDTDGVHFPAGFQLYRRSESVDRLCEPYRPKNLIARVRANHGVQTSDEYIQAALDQMEGGWFSIEGNPEAVLERVRNSPGSYVLSMVPEIGKGHVVTPYAVVNGVTWDWDTHTFQTNQDHSIVYVYDNNHPEDTNRFILIRSRLDNGIYEFPRGDDLTDTNDNSHWIGTGIYALPIEIWRETHTAMDIGQALLDVVGTWVFGAADQHVTDSNGGEWGWRADGTLVDHLSGAKSLSPLGGPTNSTRNVMLFYPATNPPPNIQINVRGSNHTFVARHSGRLFSVAQPDGVAGDTDSVAIGYDNGRLSAIRYAPQRASSNLTACIAAALSPNEHVVFDLNGMAIPGGASAELRLLPGQRGVRIQNDSGAPMQPRLTLRWVDGVSGSHGTSEFTVPEVPGGAIQDFLVHDWPWATQVRAETDLNRDGTPDQVQLVSANPAPELSLRATLTANQVTVTWPRTTLDVRLETTPSLALPVVWTAVDDAPESSGETMRVVLPASDEQRFFRLRY